MPGRPTSEMVKSVIDFAFQQADSHLETTKRNSVINGWMKRFQVNLLEGNPNHSVFDVIFDYGTIYPGGNIPDLVIRIEVKDGGMNILNVWSPPQA